MSADAEWVKSVGFFSLMRTKRFGCQESRQLTIIHTKSGALDCIEIASQSKDFDDAQNHTSLGNHRRLWRGRMVKKAASSRRTPKRFALQHATFWFPGTDALVEEAADAEGVSGYLTREIGAATPLPMFLPSQASL